MSFLFPFQVGQALFTVGEFLVELLETTFDLCDFFLNAFNMCLFKANAFMDGRFMAIRTTEIVEALVIDPFIPQVRRWNKTGAGFSKSSGLPIVLLLPLLLAPSLFEVVCSRSVLDRNVLG